MCTCESVTRWPDNLGRSTSSECIYLEPPPLSGHGSMLGAFLFYRADYESALGSSASEPDSQSGGFYNACPHFETHPKPKNRLTTSIFCCRINTIPSLPNVQLFWRINGLIQHLPLHKPTNMDEK